MVHWLDMVVVGLVGVAVGSFLNVCIDRIPAGLSLVSPPSYCPSCQTRLRLADLAPVVSYVALRGRCRYCSARIGARSPIVELTTGMLFMLIWMAYGPSYQGFAIMVYASFFLVVFVTDLESQIIPNQLILPGLAAAFVIASFWPELGPARAAIGAGAGFGLMLVLYLVPGAVVGEGDVKLAAVVGAASGFPLVVLALGMAFVLGGAVALALMASGRRKRTDHIPFGPFMAMSALVTLVWGGAILDWYIRSFWPF